MDYLQQLQQNARRYLFALVTLENILTIGIDWTLTEHTTLQPLAIAGISLVAGLLLSILLVWLASHYLIQPLRAIWQAVFHLSPDQQGISAPHIEKLHFGRELVTSMMAQLYQFSSAA